MKSFLSVLFFSLMFSCSVSAQVWGYESVNGYVFNSSVDGSFDVHNIDKTGDGTLWFNTSQGLFSKQGNVWSIVDNPNSFWIGDRYLADQNNTLWFNNGELFKYEAGVWKDVYNSVDGSDSTYARSIGKDEHGRVWALNYHMTQDSGLVYAYYLRCMTDTTLPIIFLPNNLLSNSAVFSIDIRDTTAYIVGETTIYWISTVNGLLGQVDISDFGGMECWCTFEYYDGFHMSEDGRLIIPVMQSASSSTYYNVYVLQQDDLTLLPLQLPVAIASAVLQVIGNHIYAVNQDDIIIDFDLTTYSSQSIPIGYEPQFSFFFNLVSDGRKLYVSENSGWDGFQLYFLSLDPFAANKISGHVFVDANSDGTFNNNEIPISNQILYLSGVGFYAATNDTGGFNIYVQDTAGSYTLSLNLPNENWQYSTSSNYFVTQTYAGEVSDSLNFGLIPTAIVTDVSISINSSAARPGMSTGHFISVTNNGTQPFNGQLEAMLDNQYTYSSSTWTPVSNNGNTYIFDIPTLQPFGTVDLAIVAILNANATPADSVITFANVDAIDDVNPSDNFYSFSKVITASFDPNEKTVSPTGFLANNATPAGTKLTYTVYFQNTGTDTAFTVIIRDTIASQYLDMSTFKVLASSHPYALVINGTENVAYKFNNILLPDSNTNEPLSHGFIQYEIKVKDNAPDGSLVNNTAHIYFDYNAPVVTNTTTNLIGEPNAIREINVSSISVSPNPTTDYILLNDLMGINDVTVYNTLGQPLFKQNDLVDNKVNVSELTAGFYFIEVNKGVSKSRSSFVKQ